MTAPVLPRWPSKLRPPELPPHHIRRERLHTLLDELVEAPVTAVTAPAGTGKTTLVSAWASESTMPLAWLSLDEADADERFWDLMAAALRTVLPELPLSSSDVRRDTDEGSSANDLVDELESLGRGSSDHTVLIIDEAHAIGGNEVVARSLTQFLAHLPPWLHVVLISRNDPDLPLRRMRARGQLGEIQFPELKFSLPEARAVLSSYEDVLSPHQAEDIARFASGWAASLHLAVVAARALSAHETRDDLLPLSRAATMEYVSREVLGDLPTELRDALLDLSVVRRFSRGLGHALCPLVDVDETMRSARAYGLLTEVAPPERWFEAFEMDSLVAWVLRSELQQTSPDRLVVQHARAAQWFEDAGELEPALDHWLTAGQSRSALRLVASAQSAFQDLDPDRTLGRVIDALPDEVAHADFESMVDTAWCYLTIDRHRFFEVVEDIGWSAGRWSLSEMQLARFTILRSWAEGLRGDWATAAELAIEAMSAMGPAAWSDSLGRFGWNIVARDIALSERWDDLSDEVHRATVSLSGDPPRRAVIEGTRALGLVLSGRPIDALRVGAGVRVVAEARRIPLLSEELAVAEALAHLELGDRPTALAELTSLAATPTEASLYCQVLAATSLVEAYLDCGAVGEARLAFERAKTLIETESFGASGVDRLGRVGIRLALSSGDLTQARDWCGRIGDPFWARFGEANCRIAEGEAEGARDLLEAATPRCPRHEVLLALLKARTSPDREIALKHAVGAIEQAASLGMLQTVASYDTGITDLFHASAWRVPELWMTRLEQASAALGERGQRSHRAEQLTQRERDVLRFLPSRLTVQEIADELYISRNTLKFHLKVIYRKLGVSSRAEASEIARQLR